MEGITILNQTDIMTNPGWFEPIFICAVIGIIIGIAFMLIVKNEVIVGIFAILGTVSTIALIPSSVIAAFNEVPTGRYKYECTIDESVNFIELYKKYKVIDQRGDIWVLEDKE